MVLPSLDIIGLDTLLLLVLLLVVVVVVVVVVALLIVYVHLSLPSVAIACTSPVDTAM